MSTIRELRLARGISQNDLAYVSGLSYGAISRMERGKPVQRTTFHVVCNVLGVTPENVTGVVLVNRFNVKRPV